MSVHVVELAAGWPRPYPRLLALAAERPLAPALCSKRRGQWETTSWAALAVAVQRAAQGWSARGVGPGDCIAALAPLGTSLVVTLFAAQALGASVAVAQPGAEPSLVRAARHVYVEGTHDLERWSRLEPSAPLSLVVGEAGLLPDARRLAGDTATTFHELLALGEGEGEHPRPTEAAAAPAPWVRVFAAGPLGEHVPGLPFGVGPSDRVWCEVAAHGLLGLPFIGQGWLDAGCLLLVPEPGGAAARDRQEARATVWLASADQLDAFALALQARVPADGLAAVAVRQVLARRGGLPARLARGRIAAAEGLRHVRLVRTDGRLGDHTRAWFDALGIAVTPAPTVTPATAASAPADVATPAPAPARAESPSPLAPEWAGLPS